MHSGPHTKSMHLRHGRPSCAHACQLMTFLIVTDSYICMYIHHENRSLVQSLTLMHTCTQTWHLGQQKLFCLSRCPHFRKSQLEVCTYYSISAYIYVRVCKKILPPSVPSSFSPSPVVVEAVKCLCNLVLTYHSLTTTCTDLGVLHGLSLRLRLVRNVDLPPDIVTFDLRLLFLITACGVAERYVMHHMFDCTCTCTVYILQLTIIIVTPLLVKSLTQTPAVHFYSRYCYSDIFDPEFTIYRVDCIVTLVLY